MDLSEKKLFENLVIQNSRFPISRRQFNDIKFTVYEFIKRIRNRIKSLAQNKNIEDLEFELFISNKDDLYINNFRPKTILF